MRRLDDVVRALRALGVACEAAARSETREVLAARQQLVSIGLMSHVEYYLVFRQIERKMKSHSKLDNTQV